ncbi:MAG: polyprenyl synthetase family protein, partial [Fusobacterium sp. JB021]|nr:polyprenyl synthetase family protein [Fusobacterium sp. JB021]
KKELEEYADLLGLAFQIKDDILDIEGTFEDLGKPIGSDTELQKSTYPSLIGLEESKRLLLEIVTKAKSKILDNFDEKEGKNLLKLAEYIANRNK